MEKQHKHTNGLINETSIYLLQHAHNPVDWHPWSEEILQRAKKEDKPILVSIGYAACHWCHVMERESFENEETAALMNESFINIKIDREERPDLDHIYMDAVQAMTNSGGWPLNVFLTPDGMPFYGGTYFPPVRAFNRMSWKEVLTAVSTSYNEKKHEILAQAENLTEHLITSNAFGQSKKAGQTGVFEKETLNTIAQNILKQADNEFGGFGKAPKFPQTFSIQYLLRHYHFTKDQSSLDQALLSLDKMIYGGINDQLGGGFARYSTDTEWLAPHFEKMLYDNALLVSVLSEAYQLTRNVVYANTIKDILNFTERELLSEEGGFYSALDADSEGVEGKFYTWSKQEIERLLGEDASLFCLFYDISETGNWEHTNILRILTPPKEFAADNNISVEELELKLNKCKNILMAERSTRVRPALDDKILLGWNALMNTAYSKAYAALGDNKYKLRAEANIGFLEEKMKEKGQAFFHTYKNGQAKIPAFIDDYAYLIQAYINLQEITGNTDYLIAAKKLTEYVIEHFSEEGTGYFFYTPKNQKDVILRKKEVYDGAVPSGNATMAGNLLYLSKIFDLPNWRDRVEEMVTSLSNAIVKYPTSFGVWAIVFQQTILGMKELVITGKNVLDVLPDILKKYVPGKIIQTTTTKRDDFPLLAGKEVTNKLYFFICEDYMCLKPIFDLNDFLAII